MESAQSTRHGRLLAAIAILLAVIVLLQLAILVQRQAPGPGWHHRPSASQGRSWWVRLTDRFRSASPAATAPVTPDTVWDELHQIEHMHARINRMFEDALHVAPSPAPSEATASNVPAANSAFLDPIRHMQYMRQQIDAMFAGVAPSPDAWSMGFEDGWSDLAITPGLGIRDTGDAYEVTVQLPGFDRSSLRVALDGTLLDIVAERHEDASGDRAHDAWRGRTTSRFERRLRLPRADPRPDNVKATYQDDVLRVVVPKTRPGEQDPGRVPVI